MPSAGDMAQFYLPLPVELIREIMKYVSSSRDDFAPDLAALALVSKTFHNLAIPILYHTMDLVTETRALSLIRCIKATHALSVDNAKYIVVMFFEDEAMDCFNDLMSLPGISPKTLLFSQTYFPDIGDQVASSWEARPKCMGVLKYFSWPHTDPWVCQHMDLFSHITHLFLEEEFDDEMVSFCLELPTLTHICGSICTDLPSEDALRYTQLLLDMPSMELVLIYAMIGEGDSRTEDLNAMNFPKGDLFPLLAEIPDERLYVYPQPDLNAVCNWFMRGITPWDLDRRCLTMPWRKAVKVS